MDCSDVRQVCMCVAGIPISDGVEGGGTLVIEKQLSVRGTYLVWETPKDGGNMVMRQSSAIDSGQRVHIYSADMRHNISMQFYRIAMSW
ncbi:TPA: hypothetical protein ACH3X2_010553 [Trebouxia sp. C0005]